MTFVLAKYWPVNTGWISIWTTESIKTKGLVQLTCFGICDRINVLNKNFQFLTGAAWRYSIFLTFLSIRIITRMDNSFAGECVLSLDFAMTLWKISRRGRNRQPVTQAVLKRCGRVIHRELKIGTDSIVRPVFSWNAQNRICDKHLSKIAKGVRPPGGGDKENRGRVNTHQGGFLLARIISNKGRDRIRNGTKGAFGFFL